MKLEILGRDRLPQTGSVADRPVKAAALGARTLQHLLANGAKAGDRISVTHLAGLLDADSEAICDALEQLTAVGSLSWRNAKKLVLERALPRIRPIAEPQSAEMNGACGGLSAKSLVGSRAGNAEPAQKRKKDKAAKSRTSKIAAMSAGCDPLSSEGWRMRIAVEPFHLASLTGQIDRGWLSRMKRRHLQIGDCDAAPATLKDLDREFHCGLVGFSGNKFLIDAIQSQFSRAAHVHDTSLSKQDIEDHLAVIAMLEAEDTLSAAARIKSHLEAGLSATEAGRRKRVDVRAH